NPEPFSQSELEYTIGRSFHSILQNVNLGFAPDAGTVALRQTLVDYHYETIAVNDVVTHAGAQEALFCAFNALLKAGDKVLAVAPIFDPLVQIPLNLGCDVSYVHLQASNHWSLNLDEVEENFKTGCRLFVINFPHNPTGATLTEDNLLKIVVLCKQYDVWLLSDEVFRGLEHSLDHRLPAVADIYDKGISVGVISKAFAIPGIRVGWLICKNKQFLKKVLDIKGYISICNSQVDELLASVILQKHEQLTERNLAIILPNKLLLKDMNSILGHVVDILLPDAGCCVFAQIKTNISVENLIKGIAEHKHYLLYPSSLFKTEVNALRIGFGNSQFHDFCKKIRGEK
ncbi:MAG: pyridoxal phosphate-dependent aminotransferase, partial [Proteobacteria bacterium]|nr:pyridoxal phosphate-dependent aminotransferase [Pseudomonadota bacterium]